MVDGTYISSFKTRQYECMIAFNQRLTKINMHNPQIPHQGCLVDQDGVWSTRQTPAPVPGVILALVWSTRRGLVDQTVPGSNPGTGAGVLVDQNGVWSTRTVLQTLFCSFLFVCPSLLFAYTLIFDFFSHCLSASNRWISLHGEGVTWLSICI